MSPAVLADRIAALCGAFLNELADRRSELTNLLSQVDRLEPASAGHERLLALTHSLAGRAGTFGFPQLSDAAAAVHDLVETNCPGRSEAAHVLVQAIAQVLDAPPPAGP